MKLHVGIAGPISTESVRSFIDGDTSLLPAGYSGAPLLGTLIETLLDRGHTVSAYTLSSNLSLEMDEPTVAEGRRFKIYYCPLRRHSVRMNGAHLGRIIDFYSLERRFLTQAIEIDNPDIVHAHWSYEFALAAIASKKPHLVTCHDDPRKVLKYISNLYRLGRYFMALKVMRTAEKLTTVSPYMCRALAPLTNSEIKVIPNPLPRSLVMRAFDVNKRLSQKSPVIVMVANGWGKIKNAQAGLQAFAQLRLNYPAARLRLFGEDFGRGGSADLWANKNGVAQGVEFIGPMPYADVLEEIAQADILLHPSLEESFGMVIAEAMALGIPVIGGKASGAVPWVIGDGGLVVEACDPANLAKALNSLLSSPETWHRLRNTAYMASLSRFSPDLIAAAYEDVYREQILDAGRKRDWPRGVKV